MPRQQQHAIAEKWRRGTCYSAAVATVWRWHAALPPAPVTGWRWLPICLFRCQNQKWCKSADVCTSPSSCWWGKQTGEKKKAIRWLMRWWMMWLMRWLMTWLNKSGACPQLQTVQAQLALHSGSFLSYSDRWPGHPGPAVRLICANSLRTYQDFVICTCKNLILPLLN